MPLRSHRLENRSRSGLMTSTKLPARNLAMTPRSKWPNIDADRLIAKERRMSENAEATAVASFSPCPTCRQYSHSIGERSEEHTSALQSLMRISYAVFCLKKNTTTNHSIKKQHERT